MKNLKRERELSAKIAPLMDQIQSLEKRVAEEITFALPSYEDGSLSPRKFLWKLFRELVEIENLVYTVDKEK